MATIQIRDIPDDVYEDIRRWAKDRGQSLQAYMREQVVDLARSRARRARMLAEWEAELKANPPNITLEQILADLDASRR